MASTDAPAAPEHDLHSAMRGGMLRAFFGVTAVVGLLGIVAGLASGGQLPPATRGLMLLGYGLLAAGCITALRLAPARTARALGPILLGGMALVTAVAWATGWGLQTSGLVFFSLGVVLANTMGSARLGLGSTLLALLSLALLGGGEHAGWLPTPIGVPPLASRLVVFSAAVIAGAAVGRAMALLLRQHLQAAGEREQRFRALLGIATDAYWETDAELRLSQVSRRDGAGRFVSVPALLGQAPWQVAGLEYDDDNLDLLLAEMQSRARLRDLPFCWRRPDGGLRHLLASGEPRLDARGRLLGYWGVVRDVTAEHRASQALARSQALLASVVSLSPDIITLTELQTGSYVMVNDSFCRLLGYDRDAVVGRTSADIGLWHNPADRARVIQTVAAQGMVQDELIHFVTRGGQPLPLLVSCTRVEREGKSYLLLNARDMSESNRVRLEREAILANASVGIAFTRDRRFVLANAQFEQMYGWPVGALAGQPGQAVFIDAADYADLGSAIGPTLQRGDAVDIERQAHHRDGSPFLVRLRAKAIDPTNPAENGTIWITEDVTAARQAEQDLARARDAAEAANRAKSAFLANTSHEIRTPLHGVLGLARLARQPGLPPERQRQMLDQISESAELLAVIISDILDVAKVEAGKLQLESAPFDLHALLASLQHDFSALAAGHGLAFDARFDPALPMFVRGDALRVRQIIVNFLHNALKFTAHGGIRLEAIALTEERVRIEVHDTGPGIHPAAQASLFEPFTQADTSTTRRYGGTGLGLSISRELTTLMGGSVGLSSAIGRGSCFHAELPLPAVQALADTEAALAADGLRLRGASVLMVEDNSVNMMIGVALLEQWGIEVTEAVDGRQALAAVAQAAARGRGFDAVLMDVQMPGMSGYEATQVLRKQYDARQLPVIALTAAALVSERTHALAIGMNDFLTKPIDPARLQAALLRVLTDPAPATP